MPESSVASHTSTYRGSTCLILLVLALIPFVRAESPPFKRFTTAEGLAHDAVNEIARDSRGFLWFCTAEGISRFGGSGFTNFTQRDGLPHRNVTDILETHDGTYLIATSAGLVVFDPLGRPYVWNMAESRLEIDSAEPPMFRTFVPDTDDRQKMSFMSLAQTADGTIWAGAAHALYRISRNGVDWQFEETRVDGDRILGFSDLLADSKGGLIIAATGGLYRLIDGVIHKFAENGAVSAMEAKDGRLWMGSGGHDDGIRIFDIQQPGPVLVETLTTKDGLLDNVFQYDIEQLPDGRVFVGQWAGLAEYLPDAPFGQAKFRRLNTENIYTLASDAVGNLWFGTEFRGASKVVSSGFSIFGPADGIDETVDIRSIYFDRAGSLYLPTRPVDVLHFREGRFETVRPFGLDLRSWGWHFVDFRSQDGEWWVAGHDGLRRYPAVERFADLAHTPPKKIYTTADGLHDNEIFMLFEDSRGDVWITAGRSNCLSRWDRKTDRIVSYTDVDGLPLNSGTVSHAEDKNGNLWLGFYYGSVVRYRKGRFERFTEKDGVPASLASELFSDSLGRLWLGTSGRGLYRVDDPGADVPTFQSFSTADGLSSNQVICMTEDRFGRIYVGTGRGINRIDREGKVRVFTQADGLPSNYITRCAADRNGLLWFVSGMALVSFAPEVSQPVPLPPVYIDRISVNGVPQKISALGETEVRLPALSNSQSQVQVGFHALTFGYGEDVAFQYRLNDQNWSEPSDQQTLNLDLASGNHKLVVRAVRKDGTVSDAVATANFTVLPPVWARGWFIALAGLLVTAIILTLFRYRTQNLRRINAALLEANRAEEALRKARDERLAELEQVRSRIATDLHDDIGSSLTQIAVLSEVARTQSDMKNGRPDALARITDVSNELVETMSDIVWSINPTKDHLSDLTQRMRRFASDVLTARDIEFHFRTSGVEDDSILNTNVRREVFLVFKEGINNVVKHSKATRVEIFLQKSPSTISLQVADNGIGLSETDKVDGPGGNGMNSIRRRALQLGGEAAIESAPGAGLTLRLTLPLIATHA